VQFMWDCCCESVRKTKKSSGSGCILAHCMGLGKTLQEFSYFICRTGIQFSKELCEIS
ncbi:hypothetical protein Chor_004368, partial [Crotalus horridus]